MVLMYVELCVKQYDIARMGKSLMYAILLKGQYNVQSSGVIFDIQEPGISTNVS